ncbi:hypothetical protein SAMN05444147_11073 [Pectobacterium carotovorum]|nr:hypothetical protein SAMN05444147_11073 [Pectobacterium carotovorum]
MTVIVTLAIIFAILLTLSLTDGAKLIHIALIFRIALEVLYLIK